jgi:hypothetical protein
MQQMNEREGSGSGCVRERSENFFLSSRYGREARGRERKRNNSDMKMSVT